MKLAIFDIGQTLVLNQEPYPVQMKNQIEKISKVLLATLRTSDFNQFLPQDKMEDDDYVKAQLENFESELLQTLLDLKQKKNTQYIGSEKQYYEYMSDVLLSKSIFGLSREILETKMEEFSAFCRAFFEKPENIHYNFKVMPFALEVIMQLKAQGIKLAVCSNANITLERILVLEAHGFKIEEIFDTFIISGEVQVRKPNPTIIQLVKENFAGIQNHEIFMVGDQIDRDIICAHKAGIRSVCMSYKPENKSLNYKYLSQGVIPDFSILDFRQLPSIINVMNADAAFIETQSKEFLQSYRDHLSELPSQKRIKVGLLQDGNGINQIDKFWKTGMLLEDLQMGFVHMNLDEDYQSHGKVDVILQKLQRIVPRYEDEESRVKLWELQQYLTKNNIPIIDAPEKAMVIQNRLLFLRNLQLAVDEIRSMEKYKDNEVVQKLRCPKIVDIVNDGDYQRVIAEYKERAAVIGLAYPIVIKILQASQTVHAHSFYVVSSDKGLEEALEFEGFKDELLLFQELLSHHEQLYKLYCIGDQYDYVIKTSLPEKLVTAGDCFFFQTRMKFLPESFTKFDKESRIKEEALDVICKVIGIEFFKLNLFGVDILLQEGTGNIYVIDINYYSSYEGLKNIDVEKCFKDLIIKKFNQSKEGIV